MFTSKLRAWQARCRCTRAGYRRPAPSLCPGRCSRGPHRPACLLRPAVGQLALATGLHGRCRFSGTGAAISHVAVSTRMGFAALVRMLGVFGRCLFRRSRLRRGKSGYTQCHGGNGNLQRLAYNIFHGDLPFVWKWAIAINSMRAVGPGGYRFSPPDLAVHGLQGNRWLAYSAFSTPTLLCSLGIGLLSLEKHVVLM